MRSVHLLCDNFYLVEKDFAYSEASRTFMPLPLSPLSLKSVCNADFRIFNKLEKLVLKSVFLAIPMIIFPVKFSSAAVTDPEMKIEISQICPSCDTESLRAGLVKARQKLNELGALKIGKQQGFAPVTDASIPEAVRIAAKSVLQILIVARDKSVARKFPIQLLEDNLPALSASSDPTDILIYKLMSAYLAQCKKAGLQECSVPGVPTGLIGTGSAFLVGSSGSELWTASHVFTDAVQELMTTVGVRELTDVIHKRIQFEILLFDSDGNLVATPFDNSLRITYAAVPTPMSVESPVPEVDSLRLELEKPLRPGLKIASAVPSLGDTVFHLGYPQCTGCRDDYEDALQWLLKGTRFPFPDSNGNQLRVTIGSITQTIPILSSDADAASGMSGGVSVNAEGEVVGINSRVIAETSSNRMHLVVRQLDMAPLPSN